MDNGGYSVIRRADMDKIIGMMVGRELTQRFPPK